MSRRKKTNWPLIIGFVAIAGFAIYSFASKVTSNVFVKKVTARNFKVGWTGITGQIVMEIQNNSDVVASITGFIGKLIYADSPLADLAIQSPVTIQKGTSTIIPVNVEVNFAQLPTSIVQIISSGQYLSSLRVKGNLMGYGITVPIDYPITFT